MKYCKNCNLKIDGHQNNCIFCNGKLETINEEFSTSFSDKKPKNYYIDVSKRILSFSLIALIAIAILLEIYLFNDRHYWILVSFSSLYIYLCFKVISDFSRCLVGKILNVTFFSTFETLGVFAFFDLNIKEIYFSYVYPGCIMICFISNIIIYIITGRKKFHDQLIYIFMNVLWGLTPILLLVLKYVNPTYPSSICVAVSVLIFFAFLIFRVKDSKEELKRRFHI